MGCGTNKACRPILNPYFEVHSNDIYTIRELNINDLNNNDFFNLLRKISNISEDIDKKYQEIINSPSLQVISVIIEKETNCIVGTASLIIEKKFTNNLGNVGKIEDIVVDHLHVNKGLEPLLVKILTRIAFQEGNVYKVILSANENSTHLYENLNFKLSDKQMCLYDTTYHSKIVSNEQKKVKFIESIDSEERNNQLLKKENKEQKFIQMQELLS